MEGVWLMLNQENPKNYILSSGKMHTVRHFLNSALKAAGIDFTSEGEGENEKYFTTDGVLIFKINPKFYRPAEVYKLCGDPSLAEKELGWTRKTNFEELVTKMYQSDYRLLSQ